MSAVLQRDIHIPELPFQSLYECNRDSVVTETRSCSTLETRRGLSTLVALRCGYGVAFPGVRSLGHVCSELLSSRGVRLDVLPRFPFPSFTSQHPMFHLEIQHLCSPGARSQFYLNTTGLMHLLGTPDKKSGTISLPTRPQVFSFKLAEGTSLFEGICRRSARLPTAVHTSLPAALKKKKVFSLHRGVGGCAIQEGERSLGF